MSKSSIYRAECMSLNLGKMSHAQSVQRRGLQERDEPLITIDPKPSNCEPAADKELYNSAAH